MEGQAISFKKETREVDLTTLVSLLHIHLYQTITTDHQTSPSKSTIKFAHQTKPSKRQTIKNFDYPFYLNESAWAIQEADKVVE